MRDHPWTLPGPVPQAPPPVHPLVRAARRAAERALIAARIARHGVTPCPTRFVAPSQAAPESVEPPPRRRADAPPDTVEACAHWLAASGQVGFRKLRPDCYQFLGRLYNSAALIARVRELHAKAGAPR